jgi:hypothetical protein
MEEWHREIERFVSTLQTDPELVGKKSYRSMKVAHAPDYYHLASFTDERVVKTLGERDFFTTYTERCELVSDGTVEVLPLEMVARTSQ